MKIVGYILIAILFLTSFVYAENPTDRADAKLKVGRESSAIVGFMADDIIRFEVGEYFWEFDHSYGLIAADLTFQDIFGSSLWIRPRLTYEPSFMDNSFTPLRGTSELQFGTHFMTLHQGSFDVPLPEIHGWIWLTVGKRHNDIWYSSFDFDLRLRPWNSIFVRYTNFGTRGDFFGQSQKTQMGVRIIPRLSKEWVLSFEVYYQIKGGIPYTKANSITNLFASITLEFFRM